MYTQWFLAVQGISSVTKRAFFALEVSLALKATSKHISVVRDTTMCNRLDQIAQTQQKSILVIQIFTYPNNNIHRNFCCALNGKYIALYTNSILYRTVELFSASDLGLSRIIVITTQNSSQFPNIFQQIKTQYTQCQKYKQCVVVTALELNQNIQAHITGWIVDLC